jgi:hypothetical protein
MSGRGRGRRMDEWLDGWGASEQGTVLVHGACEPLVAFEPES